MDSVEPVFVTTASVVAHRVIAPAIAVMATILAHQAACVRRFAAAVPGVIAPTKGPSAVGKMGPAMVLVAVLSTATPLVAAK